MIFVIQCNASKVGENPNDMQQLFKQQIREGCLVLPPHYSLVKTVEEESLNDVRMLVGSVDYIEMKPNGKRR